MARPGFVLEVDERTPALLVHEGEGFRLEKFPLGTRVIYPPESLPALRDLDGKIRQALDNPLGREPLRDLLFAGMKLTIVFDDLSIPLPKMKTPDIRGRIIEHVLELAASKGVDDVELIAGNSLHRRMTPAELKRTVGERVFRSFFPHHLKNHDAEDRANLVETRDHQARRSGGDQPPGGRERPDRLRQRDAHRDERRREVGRRRAGLLPQPARPPQRAHAAPLALVQRPAQLGHAPLVPPDGRDPGRVGEDLPDRDERQQQHVPG